MRNKNKFHSLVVLLSAASCAFVVFLLPFTSIQAANCSYSVVLQVRDKETKKPLTSVPQDGIVELYGTYTPSAECIANLLPDSEFGFYHIRAGGQGYETLPGDKVTVSQSGQESIIRRTWQGQVSGLKDQATGKTVTAGGAIAFQAFATRLGGVDKSGKVTLAVTEPLHAGVKVENNGLVQCGNNISVTANSSADCTFQDIFSTAGRIVKFLIRMAGVVAVAMIVVGGFYMVLSAGDPGRLKTGKGYFKNAIIGLVIVLVSYLIVNSLLELLGVQNTQSLFSNPIDYVQQQSPQ